MKMKITKAKNGKYRAVFYNKSSNIIRVDNKLDVLDLVKISKELVIKD